MVNDNYDTFYQGYLRSRVDGDDMLRRFMRPDGGMDFRREILEPGGTVDAVVMMGNFLGRAPNNRAFLRRLGIKPTA